MPGKRAVKTCPQRRHLSPKAPISSQFRQAATYVDRILKGSKPGDLPVQAPIKYRLASSGHASRQGRNQPELA
jgi:hypothetical protein